MDIVRQQELQDLANAQYWVDMAKIDRIIEKGGYVSKDDLFDQDDLLCD